MIPGSKKQSMEDEGESSFENPLSQLQLVRTRPASSGFGSSGYLFMAIVFCMMCCSSLFYSSTVPLRESINQALTTSQLKSLEISQRKLMSSDQKNSQQQQSYNLASQIEEDVEMKLEDSSQTTTGSFMQNVLSGKYTYLTYLVMSTTCFFFWLTPNCHKFRGMFSGKKPAISNHSYSQKVGGQVVTRS